MVQFRYICIILLSTFLSFFDVMAKSTFEDLTISKDVDVTVIKLKFSGKHLDYDYFLLSDPPRLTIDVKEADINYKYDKKYPEIKSVVTQDVNSQKRIVLELSSEFEINKTYVDQLQDGVFFLSFSLKKEIGVPEITNVGSLDEIIDLVLQDEDGLQEIKKEERKDAIKLYQKPEKVIIIDAGHGGKDPGAIGYASKKEKDITLDIAKFLHDELKKEPNYKVYLTRNNDRFLSLSERSLIARKYNADLFISLHADAAGNTKATGLSVYTLSDKASDAEAEKLAKKENKSDVIAGIDLTGYNSEVKDFLINLSQEHSKEDSRVFAKTLVQNLKGDIDVKSQSTRSAGFAVLKNANMVSVLIEMGYLTNKKDAKIMESYSFKKKLSKAIKKSVHEYFYKK